MKAVVFLFFAGLLAAQASNFRIVYVPQLVDLDTLEAFEYEQQDDLELFNLGNIVKNVGHNIHNTVNQATHNVQNAVHQVGHNVHNAVNQATHNVQHAAQQVGKNVHNTVNQVSHNVQHTANQVAHNVQHAANQVGHTANQVGHNIANTVNHIGKDLDKLRHAFEHGFTEAEKNFIRAAKPTVEFLIHAGGFVDAEQAWKKVDWKTGHGLPLAIQRTAKDIGKLYNNLNTISGGKLNDLALHVADKVAIAIFPPSAAVIETGKVLFKVAGQLHDITSLVKGIETDAHRGDWGGVAIDGFKLFALIAQDFV